MAASCQKTPRPHPDNTTHAPHPRRRRCRPSLPRSRTGTRRPARCSARRSGTGSPRMGRWLRKHRARDHNLSSSHACSRSLFFKQKRTSRSLLSESITHYPRFLPNTKNLRVVRQWIRGLPGWWADPWLQFQPTSGKLMPIISKQLTTKSNVLLWLTSVNVTFQGLKLLQFKSLRSKL